MDKEPAENNRIQREETNGQLSRSAKFISGVLSWGQHRSAHPKGPGRRGGAVRESGGKAGFNWGKVC